MKKEENLENCHYPVQLIYMKSDNMFVAIDNHLPSTDDYLDLNIFAYLKMSKTMKSIRHYLIKSI